MINDISFEITQKCLNNCLHCSSRSCASCESKIDFKTIQKVVDDMPFLGVRRVCLSGGEPFLHPELKLIISYINKYNIEVNIYSSGIVEKNGLPQSISLSDFKTMRNAGLTKVMFNVQSHREENYNIITNTQNRVSLIKQSILNAQECDLYTEIHFVPMKPNFDDVDGIISFAKEMGIKKVSFLKLVPHGRASDNKSMLELSDEQTIQLRSKLAQIESENIRIGIPLSMNFETEKCHAASSKLYIKYDGTVYGCEAFKYIHQLNKDQKDIKPCNIFYQSLKDIYQNSEYICATKEFVKKYSGLDSECESCPVQKFLRINGGLN